jgi:hypothetical protein
MYGVRNIRLMIREKIPLAIALHRVILGRNTSNHAHPQRLSYMCYPRVPNSEVRCFRAGLTRE